MDTSLTDFTAEELTYQIRLNLSQREIIIYQMKALRNLFHDEVALHASPKFKAYERELDILERFISQLENARMLVGERETVNNN